MPSLDPLLLIENPAQVSAGESSACALALDGVTCWGYNLNGENEVPALVIDPDGDGYTNQGGVDAFPLDPTRWLEEIASIEVTQTGDLDFTFTYAGSGKAIAGVKVVMTESDGTVTVLVTNSNGQITLPSTTNTFTLNASLAEAGEDPITLVDALQIIQYAGELRTLNEDQKTAADVNNDGEVDVLDALWIVQHQGELRTLDSSLIFLDANTGQDLSSTTFNSGDAISISTIRTGDVDQDFDPSLTTDHAPILTGPATLKINENGTSVSTLVGSDADGDVLTYSITGGADQSLFIIDPATGVLTFKSSPDYEDPSDSGADNIYDIEISVSDGTNSNSQALEVKVEDINDNFSPVMSNFSSSISVNENQTSVITISATDPDGDVLTYSISGSNSSDFNISSSGIVTFKRAPNYELKTSYSIILNVSDWDATTSKQLTINIINLNDNAPMISSLPSTLLVAENTLLVFQIKALDEDGGTLSYSLTGTDASLFNVSSSGAISFKLEKDYENITNNRFNITVTISDGTLTTSRDVNVMVTDVQENQLGEGLADASTFD